MVNKKAERSKASFSFVPLATLDVTRRETDIARNGSYD
jgi:hypothetical protein